GAGKSDIIKKQISFDPSALQSNFLYRWDIGSIGAEPGDQVEYFFEVADNDGVMGPKKARSPIHIYNLLTERELKETLDNSTEQVREKMKEAVRTAGNIGKEAKRINQDLLNKRDLNFEEKKQVEKLLNMQKELESLVR